MNNTLERAKLIRELTCRIIHSSQGSHIGSALSIADILAVLFDPNITYLASGKNDKFVLSKGHATASYYAALHLSGFINQDELFSYGKNESDLMNHVSHKVNGVEFSTGSLGHGLPFAVGLALSKKIKKEQGDVFVVTGDGEFQEGSMWESLLIACHFKLDNLKVIVDNNNLQSLTTVERTINIDFFEKFSAFGMHVVKCDGHNHSEIRKYITAKNENKPSAIICKTIKGKGVKFMENSVHWHYKTLNDELLQEALKQLS